MVIVIYKNIHQIMKMVYISVSSHRHNPFAYYAYAVFAFIKQNIVKI